MPNTTDMHIPSIVYVEDNAGDALILEEALRMGGHRIQLMVIDHGGKALNYFKLKSTAKDLPPPHCILLDNFLPAVTGSEILKFIRGAAVFNDTPVYIFSPPQQYSIYLQDTVVSSESFLTKPDTWEGFQALAKLITRSASAMKNQTIASPNDDKPEVHAEGALRRESPRVKRV
jgi:CheY-like chemotaxis protein